VYSLLRPLLFLRDPEVAHESALKFLERLQDMDIGRGWLRWLAGKHASQHVHAMGLSFAHPLGMAAGFDKDARVVLALQELGFAFVEIGTVTLRPQLGNARPRLWRFPEAHALVNALGFPSEGAEPVHARLAVLRTKGLVRIPVGINIGKNLDTPLENVVRDFTEVFDTLHDVGDYFVVNVSSPNTPGLRDLQSRVQMRPLLFELSEHNARRGAKPLLVKIAPDLVDEDIVAVGQLIRELDLAGVVAGNTTVCRELAPRAAALSRGGLSGEPLFPRTITMLDGLRRELAPHQTLIATGGIGSADQLQECLSHGAQLAQVYTSFIYHGPRCVAKLLS
jgi:dihydroorotate dehydrogenase